MVNSDHINCDCGHFDYTYWAIQLHIWVAIVQDTEKFFNPHLCCHSKGLSVNDATHTLTTFVASRLGVFLCGFQFSFPGITHNVFIDSGYKTSIQNMDELFASSIKVASIPHHSYILETGDEAEVRKIHRVLVNFPWFSLCLRWAMYHKNVSILLADIQAEFLYATGQFIGENSKPLMCRLKDGFVFPFSRTMLMFHGDPLMKRFNEIIDRVVEAGPYNHWISLMWNKYAISSRMIAIAQPLDR